MRSLVRHAAVAAGAVGQDFLCGLPASAVIGCAVVIVEALGECVYLDCLADLVAMHLARPDQGKRGSRGRFAADWLADAGRWP